MAIKESVIRKVVPAFWKKGSGWRVKRLCKYAHFIDDGDCPGDWAGTLGLLVLGLSMLKEDISKGNTENRKEIAKKIQDVIVLLTKVMDHDYNAEHLAPYYKKYGKPRMKRGPSQDGGIPVSFLYRDGKEATTAMKKEFFSACKTADKAQQCDLDTGLKLMAKGLFVWWD